MADSGAEEMDGELELLNAMFEDTGSLSISPTDASSGVAVEVRVVLQPAVDARVTTTLVAQLPVGYPRHARPVVSFVSSRGLADSDVKNLHSSAAEQVAESVEDGGTTCVFQIVEAVRGVLDEVNYSEASHQCAICLDELATTDSYTSTCFHTFHRACMGHWVAELHAKRSKSAASQHSRAPVQNERASHLADDDHPLLDGPFLIGVRFARLPDGLVPLHFILLELERRRRLLRLFRHRDGSIRVPCRP